MNEKPAAVIDIVDAANLERNLYLTLQFMEMGIPVIVALNMMDVATQRGMAIDTVKLSDLLGVPVVATVARRGEGKAELVQVAERIVGAGVPQQALEISYGEDIDLALLEMEQAVIRADFLTNTYRARWVALKYMEGDEQIIARGRKTNPAVSGVLEDNVKRVADHLKVTLDLYPEAVIADHRYGYIRSILQQGVLSIRHDHDRLYISDRIDKVLTNRFAGPLIMLAVIWGLYQFTFTYSELPVAWLDAFLAGWQVLPKLISRTA